jgi:prophage regulatory protein
MARFTARSRGQDRAAIPCGHVAKPDVMGLAEIARRLGISKRYARELAGKKGFPDPTRLEMGQVWSVEDVEAWISQHRPAKAQGATAPADEAG